jgi:hypothetical protein
MNLFAAFIRRACLYEEIAAGNFRIVWFDVNVKVRSLSEEGLTRDGNPAVRHVVITWWE